MPSTGTGVGRGVLRAEDGANAEDAENAEDGAVALETVLVLPLVVLLVAGVLGTTTVVVDQLAAARAARAAVRTVALSGDPADAAAVAQGTSPDAAASVRIRNGVATVTVRIEGDLLGLDYAVDATAVAPLEPVTGRRARSR